MLPDGVYKAEFHSSSLSPSHHSATSISIDDVNFWTCEKFSMYIGCWVILFLEVYVGYYQIVLFWGFFCFRVRIFR